MTALFAKIRSDQTKKGNHTGLKVAKSSKGYYVGWLYQEDELTKTFVRLTDYLISKHEALEWVESYYCRIRGTKGGVTPPF